MNLTFTIAEKKAFLKQRGYTIEREMLEEQQHIHGSRFVTHISARDVAVRSGTKSDIHEAFAFEMKKKLLS